MFIVSNKVLVKKSVVRRSKRRKFLMYRKSFNFILDKASRYFKI